MGPLETPPPDEPRVDDQPDREAIELSRQSATNTTPGTSTKTGSRICVWWNEHIHLGVPHSASRDHLANERTFLAHLHTANAIANFGILLAALFRSNEPTDPHSFTLYAIAVPMAAICLVMASITVTVGMWRFVQLQKSMVLSSAFTGGWDLVSEGLMCLLVRSIRFSSHIKCFSKMLTQRTTAPPCCFHSHCGHQSRPIDRRYPSSRPNVVSAHESIEYIFWQQHIWNSVDQTGSPLSHVLG